MVKFNIDKAIHACGNNNIYQFILYICVALTWFSVDFVSISFPLLELIPNFECLQFGIYVECDHERVCLNPYQEHRPIIVYANILTDYELWCRKFHVMLIGVCYTVGILFGSLLGSKLSDRIGRKPVMLGSLLLFMSCGLLLTLNLSLIVSLVLLFFIGISSSGGTMSSYLMINEVISSRKRTLYGALVNACFALAGFSYFTLFYYLKNWKYIVYISAGSAFLTAIILIFYFVESPRFLYSKPGKREKTIQALETIASRNNRLNKLRDYLQTYSFEFGSPKSNEVVDSFNISKSSSEIDNGKPFNLNEDDTITKNNSNEIDSTLKYTNSNASTGNNFNEQKDNNSNNKHNNKENSAALDNVYYGIRSLFKYKSVRSNFLICCLMWFTLCFIYYGLSMDIKKDPDTVFSNGFVIYVAESISYGLTGLIMGTKLMGRTKTLTLMMLITCVVSTMFYFVEWESDILDKISLFTMRFAITATYLIMYTYSTEIYPTVIRALGLGINAVSGRIAACLVPVIIDLYTPYLIFGVMSFVAFVFSFFLPETRGKELEEEVMEVKKKREERLLNCEPLI